jgi:hypothetical protein
MFLNRANNDLKRNHKKIIMNNPYFYSHAYELDDTIDPVFIIKEKKKNYNDFLKMEEAFFTHYGLSPEKMDEVHEYLFNTIRCYPRCYLLGIDGGRCEYFEKLKTDWRQGIIHHNKRTFQEAMQHIYKLINKNEKHITLEEWQHKHK